MNPPPPPPPPEPTPGYIKGLEGVFLGLILIALGLIVGVVIWQAIELTSLAGENFHHYQEAYDSAVVKTFVGPFEKIVGAFIVFALGKFGVTAIDNKTRIANGKEPRNISIFG